LNAFRAGGHEHGEAEEVGQESRREQDDAADEDEEAIGQRGGGHAAGP
jgi:hypothetical protein